MYWAPDRNIEIKIKGLKAAYRMAKTRATCMTFSDMIRIEFLSGCIVASSASCQLADY